MLLGIAAVFGTTDNAGAKPPHAHHAVRPAAFGIGPANSKGLDGRAYLNFLVSPGATAKDHVAVVNLTKRRLPLAVYAVDTNTADDGTLGFASRAAKPLDAGSWIRVGTRNGKPAVVVPPRTKMVLPVSVRVPTNAQPGDHAAGIIASVTSEVVSKGGRQQHLPFEQRVALRTFFRVSGDLGPKLEVQGLHVTDPVSWNPFSTSTATLTYTVRNTGNVRLGAHQDVRISGLFATATGKAPDVPVLLPGGAAHYRVHVKGVYPQFHMTARVSLHPITVPGDADPQLPNSYDATQGFWSIPWVLLILVVLIIAIAVWRIIRSRRRRTSAGSGPSTTAQEREEQPA